MNIRIEIDGHYQAVSKPSNKSRSKHKLLRKRSPSKESPFQSSTILQDSDRGSRFQQKTCRLGSKSRSKSKAKCPHKLQQLRQNQYQLEYYTSNSKGKENMRDIAAIMRENQELRKENQLLNDYFEYFHQNNKSSSSNEDLYSFKQIRESRKSKYTSETTTYKSRSTNKHSNRNYIREQLQ